MVKDLMAAPRSITVPKKRTGTSYLPTETVARAEEGSKFEKIKLAKDTTAMFTDLYEYAAKIRAGEMTWQDVEDADINTRLKWAGLCAQRGRPTAEPAFRPLHTQRTARWMPD